MAEIQRTSIVDEEGPCLCNAQANAQKSKLNLKKELKLKQYKYKNNAWDPKLYHTLI